MTNSTFSITRPGAHKYVLKPAMPEKFETLCQTFSRKHTTNRKQINLLLMSSASSDVVIPAFWASDLNSSK